MLELILSTVFVCPMRSYHYSSKPQVGDHLYHVGGERERGKAEDFVIVTLVIGEE